MAEIIKIDEKTTRIEDGGVRFFLLEGTESALLIDSGMNTPDAKAVAEGLTTLPVKLLNTHADGDHVSGNGAFEEFYMHPKESENYFKHPGREGKIVPVVEGDVLDLGGRPLKIIELPGHTPGSIAVLDVNARVLYGGDPIQDGNIYMFGEHRSFTLYVQSLSRLWKDYREEFDLVYPSHGSFPVSKEIIPQLIEASKSVLAGTAVGEKKEFHGREITVRSFGFAGFLCE